MAGRLSRFLNLEQERPAREGSRPDVSARFGPGPAPSADPQPAASAAVTPPLPVPPSAPSAPYDPEAEAATASLRAKRAALTESGISLAEGDDEQQTFLRCGICEADNFRHAVKCQSCTARLDTDEQRAFNRGFWAKRRLEDAREHAAEEQRRLDAAGIPSAASAAGLAGADTASTAPALARAMAARERQRLAWMEPSATGLGSSVGMQLLGMIRDPGLRQGALAALVLAWLGLGARGFFHEAGAPRPVSLILFFAIGLLFLPRGQRRWD